MTSPSVNWKNANLQRTLNNYTKSKIKRKKTIMNMKNSGVQNINQNRPLTETATQNEAHISHNNLIIICMAGYSLNPRLLYLC